MRTLTLALILISVGVNAQYSSSYKKNMTCGSPVSELKSPQIYIPATILITTFTVNEFSSLSQEQKTYVAISSSIITIATYLYLNKRIKKVKGKYRYVKR